jgi:hypothetical protein
MHHFSVEIIIRLTDFTKFEFFILRDNPDLHEPSESLISDVHLIIKKLLFGSHSTNRCQNNPTEHAT